MSIQQVIAAALMTPGSKGWGLPLNFIGPPGGGKTDIIEWVVRSFGMHCELFSPGERGEGAIGATPVPVVRDGKTYITYPGPEYLLSFEDSGDRGCLFLDEVNTAPPAMMPAMLGATHSRRIGGHYLGPGVRVITAMNPTEQASSGWDLPPANANRLCHVPWVLPSATQWGDWLISNDGLPNKKPTVSVKAEDEENRVMALWPNAFSMAKGLVRGFIRRKPALLHQLPQLGGPDASMGWPSHRSWENACRAIACGKIHALAPEETDMLIIGFIGEGAMKEFVQYRVTADLPDPEKVLDGSIKFKHDPNRLDRTVTILTSCASFLATAPKTGALQDRLDVMWKMIGEVCVDAADIAALAARPLSNRSLSSSKHAMVTLAKLRPLLDITDGL